MDIGIMYKKRIADKLLQEQLAAEICAFEGEAKIIHSS